MHANRRRDNNAVSRPLRPGPSKFMKRNRFMRLDITRTRCPLGARALVAAVAAVTLNMVFVAGGAFAQTSHQVHKKRLCVTSGTNCRLDFSAVPAGQQLELRFASCMAFVPSSSSQQPANEFVYGDAANPPALPVFFNSPYPGS